MRIDEVKNIAAALVVISFLGLVGYWLLPKTSVNYTVIGVLFILLVVSLVGAGIVYHVNAKYQKKNFLVFYGNVAKYEVLREHNGLLYDDDIIRLLTDPTSVALQIKTKDFDYVYINDVPFYLASYVKGRFIPLKIENDAIKGIPANASAFIDNAVSHFKDLFSPYKAMEKKNWAELIVLNFPILAIYVVLIIGLIIVALIVVQPLYELTGK